MIKAVILDLDDTLYDCSGTLVKQAISRAVKKLIQEGIYEDEGALSQKVEQLVQKTRTKKDAFRAICVEYNISEEKTNEFVDLAIKAYNSDDNNYEIEVFPEIFPLLNYLKEKYKLYLVTDGSEVRQRMKIRKLGIEGYFEEIYIMNIPDCSKNNFFKKILIDNEFSPEEVVVIGDKVSSEIREGNSLGMHTVQFLHGHHRNKQPNNELEIPDYKISKMSSLETVIKMINSHKKHPKIVCIGGGTGMPNVLRGLKHFTPNLTAVVGVTDSGRSSGMLRKDLGVLPPGDIRNCLVALSSHSEMFCDLLQYRFDKGELEGHSLGNLILVGLSEITGGFKEGLAEASRYLNITGNIYPTSLHDTHLCAERENGDIAIGEDNIVQRFETGKNKNPIKRIFLKEHTPANPNAIEAISEADAIVFGPGSHYTSVLNNLLHPEICSAVNKNRFAKKIYIANIMTQPFQTDDFKLSDHLKELHKYLGGRIDAVITNSKNPSDELLRNYEAENAFLVEQDFDEVKVMGIRVLSDDILESTTVKRKLFAKRDSLRHDSETIAKCVIEILTQE